MSLNPYAAPESAPSPPPTPPAKPGIPPWAWIFVVACGIIPLLTLGGAIPGALGFGGAGGCIAVARNPSLSIVTRVMACVGITAASWIGLVVLLVVIAAAQAGR